MLFAERFWSKVDKSGECWLWIAYTNPHGYGEIRVPEKGTMQRAHRVSWYLQYGEWPTLHVLHSCDVRACVRVDHLFLGTHADNMRDKADKGRVVVPVGERSNLSKLTEADVLQIYKSIASARDLADRYGVTPQNVYAIRSGKSWAWLTQDRAA